MLAHAASRCLQYSFRFKTSKPVQRYPFSMLLPGAIICLWAISLVMVILFDGLGYYQLTTPAVVYAMSAAIAMSVPLVVAAKFGGEDRFAGMEELRSQKANVSPRILVAMAFLCAMGNLLEMRAYGRSFGQSLEEVRNEYTAGAVSELAAGRIVYLAYLLKGGGIIAWMIALMDRPKRRDFILIGGALALTVFIEASSTGGRSLLRLMLVTSVAILFVHYKDVLVKRWKPWTLYALLLSIIIVAMQVWFQSRRQETRAQVATLFVEDQFLGDQVLGRVGISEAPAWLSVAVCQPFLYLGTPISTFGLFLDSWDSRPMAGAFAFPIVGSRFSSEHPAIVKQRVDAYFEVVGVYHNLWATALRDLCIDFGKRGIVVASLGIGLLCVVCLRNYGKFLGARLLAILIVSWMLHSPLESLNRLGTEVSIYLCISVLVLEVVMKMRLLTPILRQKDQTARSDIRRQQRHSMADVQQERGY